MTEAEWTVSADPVAMLDRIQKKMSQRQLRLFACACCRQVWRLLTDERSRKAVMVAEQFADSTATPSERRMASLAAGAASPEGPGAGAMACFCLGDMPAGAVAAIQNAPALSLQPTYAALLCEIFGNPWRRIILPPAEYLRHDGLEMRSTPILSRHRYELPHILALATAAYQERTDDGSLDPVRLAILSDALEEAGCNGERCDECKGDGRIWVDIPPVVPHWNGCHDCDCAGVVSHPLVAHLRSPGPHVRGCWALDLLLSRP